jgi:hypothetical protein
LKGIFDAKMIWDWLCCYECKSLSPVIFESVSRLSRIESGVFQGAGLIEIIIPASIEMLGMRCFYECKPRSSIPFESGSKLSRIEFGAFQETVLVEIIIPASVGKLGVKCFSECKSLSAATFESGSRLSQTKEKALIESGIHGATHQGSVEARSPVKE